MIVILKRDKKIVKYCLKNRRTNSTHQFKATQFPPYINLHQERADAGEGKK
jgi:hypothetical protein